MHLSFGMQYDLAIIGGGPAGCAAAVYAARKQLRAVLITEHFGGQSIESSDIQNWIGVPHISGADLAKQMEHHVREYEGSFLNIKTGKRAQAIEKKGEVFSISIGEETLEAKTILIATGGDRKKLDIPGAKEFEHKGVVYCASCDGPLFSGMDVAVIGGGNAGMETAAQLLAYCKSVAIVHRSPAFKADKITVEKVLAHENVAAHLNTTPTGVLGSTFVEGLEVEDSVTKEKRVLPVSGVFVEIGMMPSTSLVEGLVAFDEYKRVAVDPRNQRTNVLGVWAAGDCTNELYHQNNIAAGDGVKAIEDIYQYLRTGK